MADPLGDSVPLTGDPRIDVVTQGGSWGGGGPQALTYSFSVLSGGASWSTAAQDAVAQVLATWSAVANLTFTEVDPGSSLNESSADLAFAVANGQLVNQGFIGIGDFPDPDSADDFRLELSLSLNHSYSAANYAHPEGDIVVEGAYPGFAYLQPGGDGFLTILHEIGHALGLKHPFDDGANGRPTAQQLGVPQYDDGLWTVMSYDYTSPFIYRGNQATPMPLDILAIQSIYGANNTYHTGDDTYVLSDSGIVWTIWDAGGIDTITAEQLGFGATIDLREGGFSYHGAQTATAIAFNVTIERAIGGISGDRIFAGVAPTTLIGGLGDDTYFIADLNDTLIELEGEGTDSVESSVSFGLGTNFENLKLTGAESINGSGNDLNNDLKGNVAANLLAGGAGADTLDGGGGADTLAGGNGDDVYIYDSTLGIVIAELPGQGIDVLRGSYVIMPETDVENVILDGSGVLAVGNSLNNRIFGNGSNNQLDGGAGADTLDGGGGGDDYHVDDPGDVIIESSENGADEVYATVSYALAAGVSVEYLALEGDSDLDAVGNELNNAIVGNAGNNEISGGLGDDALSGGGGSDTLLGGPGNDNYYVSDLTTKIVEAQMEGTDHVLSTVNFALPANIESLELSGTDAIDGTGNALDNSLFGNDSANAIFGQSGNDVLIGLDGADTLDGGNGNDTLDGALGASSASDRLVGGTGNDLYVTSVDQLGADVVLELSAQGVDTLRVSGGDYSLDANVEHLELISGVKAFGNEADNRITANAYNNYVDGEKGVDTLIGLAGDDTYVVDDANDVIVEEFSEGTDQVNSFANATLSDNVEHLTLVGAAAINGTGNSLGNKILGNSSDNTLDGAVGADTLAGGAGDDVYVVDRVDDLVSEAVNEGRDTVRAPFSYALSAHLENLTPTGSSNADATGNTAENILTGNSAANRLDGAAGADTMTGGDGDDTYIVDDSEDRVVEAAGEGNDSVYSSASFALGANVETIVLIGSSNIGATGNSLGNSLIGNGAANTLDGGGGADTMVGGAGNDAYVIESAGDVITEAANQGIDAILSSSSYFMGAQSANVENLTLTGTADIDASGNAGNNLLTGNAGDNRLDGLAGADTMAGGLGDDVYVVDNKADLVTELAGEGNDTVQISASFALKANIENLVLTGTAALAGTGDAGANSILGNGAANVLTGNAGNDSLDGGAGADRMLGGVGDDRYVVDRATDVITEAAGAGSDTVESTSSYTLAANIENLKLFGAAVSAVGNAGNNSLTGTDGANLLDGKGGADIMTGGKGDDVYVIDNGGDLIVEAADGGSDEVRTATAALIANIEHYTFTGATAVSFTADGAANKLTGTAKNDTLAGEGGNDTLDGKAGADNLAGGAGDDTYVVDNAKDIVDESGGTGTDKVQSTLGYVLAAGLEKLELLGSAAINGTGNEVANDLIGNKAANKLDGMGGADTLEGKGGNDTYTVGAGDQVIETIAGAAGGIDLVLSAVSFDLSLAGREQVEKLTLSGGALDNIDATGNTLANTLAGNAGNNKLDGKAGADSMAGGLGDDTYVVDLKTDAVTEAAKAGTDTVQSVISYVLGANLENLLLLPAGGNIDGTGNALDNEITGNAGNNRLDGKAGADLMLGHGGNDTYVIDNAGDVADETGGDGIDTLVTPFATVLGVDFENLTLTGTASVAGTGNESANVITGNSGANALSGLGDDDSLAGGAGNDSLAGGSGNDRIDGGSGADTLTGGAGNDTYIVDNAKDVVTEAADGGIDAVNSSVTHALAANVENLTLAGAGVINGTGNDLGNAITGNTAANILSGGLGDDSLDGGKGNDKLSGGEGSDTLLGGAGADLLTGGAGSDTFLRHSLAEGKDTITDFQAGPGGDVLDIADLLIGYSAGHEAEFVQCVTAGGNTTVKVDADGLGTAAKFTDVCVLTGVTTTVDGLLAEDNLMLSH